MKKCYKGGSNMIMTNAVDGAGICMFWRSCMTWVCDSWVPYKQCGIVCACFMRVLRPWVNIMCQLLVMQHIVICFWVWEDVKNKEHSARLQNQLVSECLSKDAVFKRTIAFKDDRKTIENEPYHRRLWTTSHRQHLLCRINDFGGP